ncbi:hypothetical protein EKO27_g9024 [Xylaria grammica]|uniref:Uncharacterized protein n=1 Tax=Xylaria grammica TaxID=363999 RepID=A0A439CVJ9_9PEZI|nr:hypothetical protein EKO27_g9024 [Xylaria grammica]
MAPNGSRIPQRKPGGTNNNTHSVDHGRNNCNTDQAYIDGLYDLGASLFGSDLTSAFNHRPLLAGQNFVAEFPYHDAHWLMAHQLPLLSRGLDVPKVLGDFGNGTFYTVDGPAGRSPSHLDMAPTYSMFPPSHLSPASGYAAHAVGGSSRQPLFGSSPMGNSLLYWAPPPTPTSIVSSLTVAASSDDGNLPPYRCLTCPNMPRFGNQKDLERHISTTKAHWGEETQFYWCCCGEYERPRKDHHLRHVESCNAPVVMPYTCKCGGQCAVRDEHVDHVVNCGRTRRRRQPTAS